MTDQAERNSPELYSPAGRPVVFGEVLFDRFDDGSSVLGGAPFNVVWHLQAFGLQPLLISRIGDDGLGEQLITSMENWGMDTRGIQRDKDHPTGTVNVSLNKGQPTFDIVPERAYDFVDEVAASAILAAGHISLLYHGTLGARNAVARQTLDTLRSEFTAPCFVDINLRPPWWSAELVSTVLRDAKWAKINDAELREIANIEHLETADLHHVATALRQHFGIDLLIVTCGEKGAFIDAAAGQLAGAPAQVAELVDTVGAGDAFSAVTILGLSRRWPLPTILQRALTFAAAICGIRGATTMNKKLYNAFLDQWEHDDA